MNVWKISFQKHFALKILRISAIVVFADGLVSGEIGAVVSFSLMANMMSSVHGVGAFEMT